MIQPHDTHTSPMPTPGAGPQMRMLQIGSIVASRTNPRKHFDGAKLQELADDIKARGVNQTILVRPLPASRLEETNRAKVLKGGTQQWPLPRVRHPLPIEYELVAGERRWRACQLAEVDEAPAMIRNLSDQEVSEIQLTENLQRDDLSDLEEAEGYESLIKEHGIKAEDIGGKIHKSRSYVYARLKLLDLCNKPREALRSGEIDFSRGLLIARIPNEGLQHKALEYCLKKGWNGERPSQRECADHIQEHYMLKLASAPFKIDNADLLPAAGSCKDCPKRTGANPDLFTDVKGPDLCIDPTCYKKKEEAHTAALVRQAKDKGQTVIAGDEAKELVVNHYTMKLKGYRRLDSVDDSPTDQPLRKIIGAQMKAEGITPVLIESQRKPGEMVAVLPNDVALRLLKTVEAQAQAAQQVSKEVRQLADEKKAKAEAKAKAQYERAWRDQLMKRTWAKLTDFPGNMNVHGFNLDVHRYLVLRTVNSLSTDDAEAIAAILNLGKVGAHSALADFAKNTASPDDLQLLCIMQQDSSVNDHSYGGRIANHGLHLVAGNVFKDDLAKLIEEVKAQAAERYLPKPEKAAAPKSASTPPPAAQATPTRANPKTNATPAALAREHARGKTTKAQATAEIAAALGELEGAKNQAPAAQSDEAPAVPGGQPAASAAPGAADAGASGTEDQAPAAQGLDALPVAGAQAAASAAPGATDNGTVRTAAWPFPKHAPHAQAASSAVVPTGDASADANTGAAATEIAPGVRVRINETATGKYQKPWIDYEGVVVEKRGDRAWDVDVTRSKRSAPKRVSFDFTELEVLE